MPGASSTDDRRPLGLGRARAERIGLTAGALLLFGTGFVPQLGGPGYEAALVSGLLLPSIAALTAAQVTVHYDRTPSLAIERGALLGAVLGVIGLAVTLVHGLRLGSCDFWEGVSLYLLGPFPGTVLGGISGAFAGLWARFVQFKHPRTLALVLALGGPVVSASVSAARFITSPMVYAYDPYVGYFSGPLYDTVIGSLVPLGTYRLGTLATLVTLVALAKILDPPHQSLTAKLRSRPRTTAVGLLALSASLTVTACGSRLGHFSTAASIQEDLGRRVSVGRCTVVHSFGIPERDARRLARECTAHLAQVERFFGVSGTPPILVYLFGSEEEKARATGAGRTSIAKPWRQEVYLQAAGYPHPILGHELAHVVAGRFGQGPFRIAGPLAGWVPDPGRIEGIATAAAPDEDSALTLEEWAAAMQRLELLPPLKSLFRLGFFGQTAAQAYTAAGAFIGFLRSEHGPSAIQRWYGGEPLERVTGSDLSLLERRWHAALAKVPLSKAALTTARARFEHPAFFERRCPRVIDRLLAEAGARLSLGDLSGARQAYQQVLELDRNDPGARLGLSVCAARAGNEKRALLGFRALASSDPAAPWAKLSAREARADLLLRTGKIEEARHAYAELARDLVDEDRLRTLEVKASANEGVLGDAIVALLIGDQLGPSWDVAAPLLGEAAARIPTDGLADYLIGRNLLGRGRFFDAIRHLDRALARPIEVPRVLEEALRVRVIAGCAIDDSKGAEPALDRLLEMPIREARRAGILRFAERCGLRRGRAG